MIGLFLAAALALQAAPQASAMTQAAPHLPRPDEVMAIPEELRQAFQKEVLDVTAFPEARMDLLVKFTFDRQGLGITYNSDATRTVAESFQTRTVNCLSSTLLVVALAREAGLKAQGQRVDGVLVWGAKGEVAIQSQHVNAIIEVPGLRRFVVDVDSSDVLAAEALNPIGDEQLLAYFYGNRAMELMMDGRIPEAQDWLREALRHAPDDASLLNNAGVLSLRLGEVKTAESQFLQAVENAPRHISVLSNLVSLYQRQGDVVQEAHWRARSEKVLRKAPYYQYQLGEQHESAGDMQAAIRYYRRAVDLKKTEHRFHLALARAYFAVGELRKAERELTTARDLAEGAPRQRYQDKLAALRRIRQ